MKTYWLTIAGLVFLALVVVITAKVFWFAETAPTLELRDAEQTQKKVENDLKTQLKTQQPEAEPTFKLAKPRWTKTTEKHYDQMLKQVIKNPQSEKASALLSKQIESAQRQYNAAGHEMPDYDGQMPSFGNKRDNIQAIGYEKMSWEYQTRAWNAKKRRKLKLSISEERQNPAPIGVRRSRP